MAASTPQKKKTKKRTSKVSRFKYVDQFLSQNPDIDLASVNLLKIKKLESLNWKSLTKHQDLITKQLKAYQRLIRVLKVEDFDLIKRLIEAGIHSAIQIAAIPKAKFIKKHLSVFKDDKELIEKTYKNALTIRSQLLLKYIDSTQKANAPSLTR